MMPNKTTKATKAASAAKHGIGAGKILAIIVAVVVIGGVGYFALNQQHAPQRSLPYFPNLNTPLPSAFASLPTAPPSTVPQILAAISSQSLANQTQFNVTYLGSIDVQGTGARSIISVDSPLYYNYSSYGTDGRLQISLPSASVFGFVSIGYFNLTNGSFTCTNFNGTAASEGNIEGVILGSRSISCISGSELAGFDLSKIAKFDLSVLQDQGIQFANSTSYESIYNGVPCTYVTGSLLETSANGDTTGTGAYGVCYSDSYGVPLSLTAYFNGTTGSFFVNLNETHASNSASQSYVDSLPA